MSSLVTPQDLATARTLIWVFARTYRLEDGRFVNKVGEKASDRTLQIVSDAQALLAGAS
ncbi:MAG TPA: hypothetical protein VIG24_02530 [Acidimicrobiia bacterium]